jgi:hypothetical protein
MPGERLTLRFREREVDDVLKSMVVVEQNLGPNETPSTVSALLPRSGQASGPEDPTEIELVFSPAARRPMSIAYAVPTAARKATYRVILPARGQKEKRALLQAWALISNIGDEDWSEVNVTLATGAPLDAANDELDPLRRRRAELIDRAAELRESLRTIERTPQAGKLRQTLLDRLAEVARQSEEVGAKITQRVEDVAMARAELDDTLRDLVIEGR